MLLIQLNLQNAAGISASSATTNGADLTASQAGAIVAASSATTDGADLTAGNVTVVTSGIDASSTTTNGADVANAAIEIGQPEAMRWVHTAWQKSYLESLHGTPIEDKPKEQIEPLQEPATPAESALQIVSSKQTDISRQAMRRSLQAAMRDAQMQALADLRQTLINQQAAIYRLQMEDDEDALLALLLA